MALYMPTPMRALGLAIHTAASDFADVAAQAETTHNVAAVLKALARITPNCVACHSAYRLR
jgi:cytochrome c556